MPASPLARLLVLFPHTFFAEFDNLSGEFVSCSIVDPKSPIHPMAVELATPASEFTTKKRCEFKAGNWLEYRNGYMGTLAE